MKIFSHTLSRTKIRTLPVPFHNTTKSDEEPTCQESTQTLRLIHDIEELEPAVKDKLFFLANAVIRDAKTTKAYSH